MRRLVSSREERCGLLGCDGAAAALAGRAETEPHLSAFSADEIGATRACMSCSRNGLRCAGWRAMLSRSCVTAAVSGTGARRRTHGCR